MNIPFKVLRKVLSKLGLLVLTKNTVKKLGLFRIRFGKYKDVLSWNLNYRGVDLAYDTSELYTRQWFFPRYANEKIHEPATTDAFIDYIELNSVVLDIGGHIGYFSCIGGSLAKNGSVHVFEADPKCISLINKNVILNGLNNVHVHNYAVSNSEEYIKIPQLNTPHPGLVINSKHIGGYISVKGLTIDSFLATNGVIPNFIKIDIEGAEWNALQGMHKTLEKHSPTLLVEIHIEILKQEFNIDYKEIIKLLIGYGYKLYSIAHRNDSDQNVQVHPDSQLRGNIMLLCTKK
jgi:FkbM family methyltransferase